jgi:hypothetical protein
VEGVSQALLFLNPSFDFSVAALRYSSGERQMDRALQLLKAFVVSSRAFPPPKALESSSSASSSAAARLPALLDFAVPTHTRPREGCVVVYRSLHPATAAAAAAAAAADTNVFSQHPRRIGHAHPLMQPPPSTRVMHLLQSAVHSLGAQQTQNTT